MPRKQRQVDFCEFDTSLSHTVAADQPKLQSETLSQGENKQPCVKMCSSCFGYHPPDKKLRLPSERLVS